MADYKRMYLTLFNGIEDAMAVLREAAQKAEEIYIQTDCDGEEQEEAAE